MTRATFLTDEECVQRINQAREEVRPGTLWKHVKTGKKYRVIQVSLYAGKPAYYEVTTPLVTYRGGELTWTRPLSEFKERFEHVLDAAAEPEPGDTIWEGDCPSCGAHLDVHVPSDEDREYDIVWSPGADVPEEG